MSKSTIPGFTKLNASTSIYRPEKVTQSKPTAPSPDLIVFCAWMGAAPKHIAKYTAIYQEVYPHSTILVLESTVYSLFFDIDFSAACDVVEACIKPTQNTSEANILLHTFSNGGSINAVNLAKLLVRKHGYSPFSHMILDSCPSKADIGAGTRAVTMSLPQQPVVQFLGFWMVWISLLLYKVSINIIGGDDVVSSMRKSFNDPALFPTTVPKLYLYSKADKLVYWRVVREHAEEAKAAGYSVVREVVFEKAMHCALMSEDREKYWGAIKAHVLREEAYFG